MKKCPIISYEFLPMLLTIHATDNKKLIRNNRGIYTGACKLSHKTSAVSFH